MAILREACGVIGICGHQEAVTRAYYGLFALQHRGQESAGMAVVDAHGNLMSHRGMGLTAEVFSTGDLDRLKTHMALGHVRYSTHGASDLSNAQPLTFKYAHGQIALAHNGNIANTDTLKRQLEKDGSIFQSTSDTETVAHLMARAGDLSPHEALQKAVSQLRGGFALLALTPDCLMGARDPHGIRPLVMGRLDNGSHVLASESCALDVVGAQVIREVEGGEMVVLRPHQEPVSIRFAPRGQEALCMFEYIYFARPDSDIRGANVHLVRKELGRVLAREHPAEADLVTGVPDSSISAAAGYAEEAGIPYELGLIKNRYIGRTFIQPDQSERDLGVKLKLNPIRAVVEGKRVALIDDSIVRGTTSRYLVKLMRGVGAREVHLRIASPPYRNACYYGIDTSAAGDLLAARAQVEQIRELVGADSLGYISWEGTIRATGGKEGTFCMACFDGLYPAGTPGDESRKEVLREQG